MAINVTVDKSSYEQTGKVTFRIVLKNNGEGIFTNVIVAEETMGSLGTYDVLMPGEKDIDTEAEISANAVFRFKVTAIDPDGKAVTVSSSDVPVEVVEEKKPTSGLGTAVWIVIIVFVLMVGAGIALIILVNKEKKSQKKPSPNGRGPAQPETRKPRVERMAPAVAKPPMEEPQEEEYPEKGNFRDFDIQAEEEDADAPAQEETREEQRPTIRRKVAPKVDPEEFEDRNNF